MKNYITIAQMIFKIILLYLDTKNDNKKEIEKRKKELNDRWNSNKGKTASKTKKAWDKIKEEMRGDL